MLPMHILIIEDEPKTGDYLQRGLRESGFTVSLARNGRHGLHLACEEEVDLVVLDVMLPDINGKEVCQRVRGDGTLDSENAAVRYPLASELAPSMERRGRQPH